MSKYTETQVLHHHGITGTGDTLTDNARAAGIITACLGCGSVQGIDPTAPLLNHASVEAARVATRDALGLGEDDCCGPTILY